ncbi:MAG: excisionase family DNA binding protein [Candidatus Aldehydirespiratoraceae bacterium]|jgi:excisionase family DNA binding protein
MSVTFTLQEAADELGVHYMTAYRYVRLGLLAASKVGSSWQVEDAAIAAFRDGSAVGPVKPGESAPWVERLEARLVECDAQGAWGVVEAAMTSGAELEYVYLDMLSGAMVNIGDRWVTGELDVAIEHQATVIVMRIIGRLGSRCVRRGRALGSLIVGAPMGEYHALPTAILGDMLRLRGWDVVDLGANTPSGSFLHAAARTPELRAVGFSATYNEHLGALSECCSVIKQEFPDVLVIVGGPAIRDEQQALALGADAMAAGPDSLHKLLTT